MDKVNILTSQNVIISNKTANVGERIISTVIDFGILIFYFLAVYWIFTYTEHYIHSNIFLYLLLIPIFVYHLLSEIFLSGQSVGKKAMGIKVVKLDGSQPSVLDYFIRWIFRIVDVNLFGGIVAIIVISSNGKGQRLGDIVAKTSVVNIRDSESVKNTILVELPENYEVSYSEAELLSDSDVKVVKEVLDLYEKNMFSDKYNDIIEKTTIAVSKKIRCEVHDRPYLFLKKIISDYNFIHRNL